MPKPGSARRPRHRLLIGGLLGGLLVLTAIAWVIINPSAIAERVKERALTEASQRLGRKVEAGPVHVHILPHFGASLDDLSVAGGEGEPSLLKVGETTVALKLWPLIRSRGQDVQISRVTLRDIDLNLVRRSDGTWSYEGLGGSGDETAPAATPSGTRPDVAVSEVLLKNGSVKVIDLAGGKEASSVAFSHLDLTAKNVGLGRPVSLEFTGDLAADAPNLSGSVAMDALPASAAELRAGRWPKMTGQLKLDRLELANVEGFVPVSLTRLLSTGRASADLALATLSVGHYALDGTAKLDELAVRGAPASGSLRLRVSIDAARPDKSLVANIDDLKIQGQGVDLGGQASFTAQPRRVTFAIDGSRLDLDTLLAARTKPAHPPKELVPASMRSEAARTQATGTIRIGELNSGQLRAHDLDAQARLERGLLTLTQATVGLYSGRATLTGTTINLAEDKPVWNTRVKLEAVDLQSALHEVTGSVPASGLLSGEVLLSGKGNEWSELMTSLSGNGLLSVATGALTGVDLGADIAQPLATALRAVGLGGAASTVGNTGSTPLKDLSAKFDVKGGWLDFHEPLKVQTPFGGLELAGRLGLDRRLALTGVAKLSKSFLAQLGADRLVPDGTLDVPLNLVGTLDKPSIQGVDWGGVARAALTGALQQKGKDGGKSIMDEAQERLRGLLRGT